MANFVLRFLFMLLLGLVSLPARATEDCKTVLREISELNPLLLKYDSIREEMGSLRKEIAALDDHFKGVENNEKFLLRGAPATDVAKEAGNLSNRLAREASELLEHYNGTDKERRILEGYKMLLKRTQRLQERAEYLAVHPEAHEKEKQEFKKTEQKEVTLDSKYKEKEGSQDPNEENGKNGSEKANEDEQSDENQNQDSKKQSLENQRSKKENRQANGTKEDKGKSSEQEQAGGSPSQKGQKLPQSNSEGIGGQQGQPSQSSQGNGSQEPIKPKGQKSGEKNPGQVKGENHFPSQASREEQGSRSRNASSKTRKSSKPKKRVSRLKKLDEMASSGLLKGNMELLWVKTLRQYDSRESLASALNAYRNFCEHLLKQNPNFDFLKQQAEKAAFLQEKLALTKVQYKSLEELALSVYGSDPKSLMPALRYLKQVFTELTLASRLTVEEERTHEKVLELLGKIESKDKHLSQKELGEAFVSQLLGPLSRNTLTREFSTSNRGELNWHALAEAIQNGSLNDLAIYGRLKPFLDVFEKQVAKPSVREEYQGHTVPINEADPELQLAQELDRMPFFYRDGSPPKQDILRLLSGDMLENTYPEKVKVNNPKKPIQKKVTVVVYDVSNSMETEDNGAREIFRNALIQAYLDHSQVEVVMRKADHTVYTMAFDTIPHSPERIGSVKEAEAFFDRMRLHPIGSSGGTEITMALVSTYEKIAEQQKTGGELIRANILLITDGEEPDGINFREIEAARRKIDPKVEIILNAISLGDSNSDLERFVRAQGKGNLGKLYYQYVSPDQMSVFLNPETRMKNIEKSAQDTKIASDASHLRSNTTSQLKELLSQLAVKRSLEQKMGDLISRDIETSLSQSSIQSPDAQVTERLASFLDAVQTPISSGWSKGERAETLETYIDSIAREYKIDSRAVIPSMSEDQRKALLKWLKGGDL